MRTGNADPAQLLLIQAYSSHDYPSGELPEMLCAEQYLERKKKDEYMVISVFLRAKIMTKRREISWLISIVPAHEVERPWNSGTCISWWSASCPVASTFQFVVCHASCFLFAEVEWWGIILWILWLEARLSRLEEVSVIYHVDIYLCFQSFR